MKFTQIDLPAAEGYGETAGWIPGPSHQWQQVKEFHAVAAMTQNQSSMTEHQCFSLQKDGAVDRIVWCESSSQH